MEVREYVVCYFDFLGQREGLLKKVRNGDDIAPLQEEIDKISNLVQTFNDYLRQTFDTIKNRGPDILKLMGIAENNMPPFLEKINQIHFGIQQYSDSTMFYVDAEDGYGMGFGLFIDFCLTFAAHYLNTVSEGMLVRGAITMGKAWEISPNCLYGPVLEDVYLMESSIAHYPRIVINQDVVNRVQKLEKEAMASGIPNTPSNYLTPDFDGIFILDYLSKPAVKWYMAMNVNQSVLMGVLKKGLQCIRMTLESLQQSAPNDVATMKTIQKYGYLRSYWTSRIDILIELFEEQKNSTPHATP